MLCQERFWVVADLKRRYRNGLDEWMNAEGRQKTYSWYLADPTFVRIVIWDSSCLGWQVSTSPMPWRRPRLVWERNSAAPPNGFATIPIRPFPKPDITPFALSDVDEDPLSLRVNVCSGWSATPAIAPMWSSQRKILDEWNIRRWNKREIFNWEKKKRLKQRKCCNYFWWIPFIVNVPVS